MNDAFEDQVQRFLDVAAADADRAEVRDLSARLACLQAGARRREELAREVAALLRRLAFLEGEAAQLAPEPGDQEREVRAVLARITELTDYQAARLARAEARSSRKEPR